MDETTQTLPEPEEAPPGQLDFRRTRAVLQRKPLPVPGISLSAIIPELLRPEPSPAAVAKYHQEVFDATAGAEEPHLREHLGFLESHVGETSRYLRYLQRLVAGEDVYRDIEGEGTPWTGLDVFKVSILAVVSVVLQVVGLVSVAQILHSSGVPGFESTWRCLLFNFVPVATPFVMKVLAGLFAPGRSRRYFARLVSILGICLGLTWCLLFVQQFKGGFGSDIGTLIGDLVSNTSAPSAPSGDALLYVGLLAEIFLASACWIEIERLAVEVHQQTRRVPNPRHVALQKLITECKSGLLNAQDLRGEVQARVTSIDRARSTFIQQAVHVLQLRLSGITLPPSSANGCATPIPTAPLPRSGVHNNQHQSFTNRSAGASDE